MFMVDMLTRGCTDMLGICFATRIYKFLSLIKHYIEKRENTQPKINMFYFLSSKNVVS